MMMMMTPFPCASPLQTRGRRILSFYQCQSTPQEPSRQLAFDVLFRLGEVRTCNCHTRAPFSGTAVDPRQPGTETISTFHRGIFQILRLKGSLGLETLGS